MMYIETIIGKPKTEMPHYTNDAMELLAKLADYCNQYGIKVVFSENAASPQVSATLAKEVGASVQTIYTIESSEDGLSYMERMTSNIEKIYKSLAQ